MTPAAKSARLSLLRESWERYRRQRRRAESTRGRVLESSGRAYFTEQLYDEALSTFADVGEPDALSQLIC